MERDIHLDEKIKKIVYSSPKGYHNTLKLKENAYIVDYIKAMTPKLDGHDVNLSTRIYWLLNGIEDFPRCKVCGKILCENSNANAITGYGKLKYCSQKCQHQDPKMQQLLKERITEGVNNPAAKEKFKQTCIEKFGATSPLASKEIQEKIKHTNIERYGVDNPIKSNEIKEKIKQTNIERYGCENVFSNEDIKSKIKSTWMDKYGEANPNKSEIVKKKIKHTNIERFGVDCHLSLKEIREQLEKTKRDKYGEHLEKIVEKQRTTSLEKYGFDNPEKANGWRLIQSFREFGVESLFTKEEYNKFSFKEKHKYKWKCMKCGNVFEDHVHMTCHNDECYVLPRCWKCYPRINQFSKKEKDVLSFIRSIYNGPIEENARILEPNSMNNWTRNHELDIYIPGLKLAIEFNGDHFHDYERFPEVKINDDFKRIACESLGIKLIVIWEHDWDNDTNAVKNMILAEMREKHNGVEI